MDQLPPFDASGNLPPGLFAASWEEVRTRFGKGSPRREWLTARLVDLVEECRRIGRVNRVILWGSYVTAKAAPGDIDILLVLDAGFDDAALAGVGRDLFDHRRARVRFTADVFWVRETIGPGMIDLMLETYQIAKDKRRRGIVEVLL